MNQGCGGVEILPDDWFLVPPSGRDMARDSVVIGGIIIQVANGNPADGEIVSTEAQGHNQKEASPHGSHSALWSLTRKQPSAIVTHVAATPGDLTSGAEYNRREVLSAVLGALAAPVVAAAIERCASAAPAPTAQAGGA